MAEILEIDPSAPQPDRIARAAHWIRQGEVIAIPTDTLYGLAADPFQTGAVERVFQVKGRPPDAPVLLLVDSIEMATGLSSAVPKSFQRLAERFWPGPLTIVVDASPQISAMVTAGTGQVGLRLPAAAIPRALSRALGGPITGTSANQSGRPACRSAREVDSALGERLPLIIDGGSSPTERPSSVVRLTVQGWDMIREGAIQRDELEALLESA